METCEAKTCEYYNLKSENNCDAMTSILDCPRDIKIVGPSKLEKAVELLRVAQCPECDGSGTKIEVRMVQTGFDDEMGYAIGEPEPYPVQCQWCHEKQQFLSEVE